MRIMLSRRSVLSVISGMSTAALMISCSEDLPKGAAFESYVYASVDSAGGDWDPLYLTGSSLVSIPAPEDISSAAYLDELNIVKSYNNALSDEQQQAVDYWGNNAMIRWMEIACELVSKYNLAPAPNQYEDYDVPDGVFPGTYPFFPFAHPPYASRAYAYFSASVYDALITAWHYKYLYNRPAPYIADPSIIPGYPDNHLPSYPSEDAVIATVSEDVLTFMFPLEADYIAAKAQELRDTRIWAGMNVQSDIAAGDSIGHTLADIFIGRAKNDSMRYAQVEEDEYDEMEADADALWLSSWPHWENQEVPQRPIGITPKYGHVVPWWIHVEDVRPGPPPAFGSAQYNTDVAELLQYKKDLTDEQEHIAYFWGDGFGTYTPAGHWDFIANEYIINYKLNPLRTARVMAYLNTAMEDAGISCWDTKYYYMYPRPLQANSDVIPLFGLPNFPSYTSGHSTFSGAAAAVLSYFFPSEAAIFDQYAHEASDSRIYARIHYRFDCETGLTVGNAIGEAALEKAKTDGAD